VPALEVALFEDDAWADFAPLSSTRHVAQQLLGTAPIFEHVARQTGTEDLLLLGRRHLKEVVQLRTKLKYNDAKGPLLLVNARVNPLTGLKRWVSLASGSAVMDRGDVAVAAIRSPDLEKVVTPDGTLSRARLGALVKGFERIESSAPLLFSYPWDLLEANGEAISAAAKGAPKKLALSADAEVEKFVSFDVSGGPVIVEDGARIEAFSRISGPCYIGRGATVQSALVRGGTTLGEGSKVGGEVANSIVYRRSNKAHFGYLGHSIVGEWVNIGAGAVTSDLKNTYGTVKAMRGREKVDTGLVKLGTMVGDMAKISIGSMIYGGRTLGVGAWCSGVVDADVPDFTSYTGGDKTSTRLKLEPVLRAQVRMMARRNEVLTPQERKAIERLYSSA
jgi:UDP-N-acetylglucosamine diphosphorylase/glucosamine-1-phosphate N-acetyltransferase